MITINARQRTRRPAVHLHKAGEYFRDFTEHVIKEIKAFEGKDNEEEEDAISKSSF